MPVYMYERNDKLTRVEGLTSSNWNHIYTIYMYCTCMTHHSQCNYVDTVIGNRVTRSLSFPSNLEVLVSLVNGPHHCWEWNAQ